ncbi:hypothetical protein BCR42DRAFT_401304 [Absidia repens]|uniref:Uncharacterized protein n=1 Tax=Absidia repens TaxID=90262 RepID=A0A1X2J2E3_9FUNG|nr:hypothetical protein BCR42DRAFT_401304 [Absidia repens]
MNLYLTVRKHKTKTLLYCILLLIVFGQQLNWKNNNSNSKLHFHHLYHYHYQLPYTQMA